MANRVTQAEKILKEFMHIDAHSGTAIAVHLDLVLRQIALYEPLSTAATINSLTASHPGLGNTHIGSPKPTVLSVNSGGTTHSIRRSGLNSNKKSGVIHNGINIHTADIISFNSFAVIVDKLLTSMYPETTAGTIYYIQYTILEKLFSCQ